MIGNASKGRVAAQRGMASVSVAKSTLTIAALAATAWSARPGRTPAGGGPPHHGRVIPFVFPAVMAGLGRLTAAAARGASTAHLHAGLYR